MQEIVNKFTTHLKNVLTRALSFVVENGQEAVRPEHIFWALASQKGSIGAEILAKAHVKLDDVRQLLLKPTPPPPPPTPSLPVLSDDARRVVEKAVLTANIYEHRYVGTEHLLSGLMQIAPDGVMRFLHSHGINIEHLKNEVAVVLKSTSRFPDLTAPIKTDAPRPAAPAKVEGKPETPALDFFAYELTSEAAQESIDPVIGREAEIERVMQILCRRMKNNPILLGEPGVGKTAIVEGLSARIFAGRVPPPLQGKRVFALDLSLVVAGTMYRGEFEGRLKQIIDEIKKHEEMILFIDEVHTIIGAGSASGSLDAANILKPALARGEIHCIGATTLGEYKKNFETDAALERRFCPVTVEEPDAAATLQILQGVRAGYEAYHQVRITDAALGEAVVLSGRYIEDKHQPDKALDLIDESAAAVRLKSLKTIAPSERQQLQGRLRQVREQKRSAVVEERFEVALALKTEEERLMMTLERPAETLPVVEPLGVVDDSDVALVVARMTGVPLTEIEGEQKKFKTLEATLGRHVLGQAAAVKAVAEALRRAHTHVSDPRRPLASFLFLGPSGVGKTELARAIAREVFQDDKALVTLDMSEFAEAFSVSKLIGAPAGYVGYREATKLTDRIKQKPYAVVLFDELEKGHRDVHGLLLQILESGGLTDSTGRAINFKNTVIVMTTNVGHNHNDIGFAVGATPSGRPNELEEHFRPELLNRIDHLCLFEPLSPTTLQAITQKQLSELVERLAAEKISLKIDQAIAELLGRRVNPQFGARDVRRQIQEAIENPLAGLLLNSPRPARIAAAVSGDKITLKRLKA